MDNTNIAPNAAQVLSSKIVEMRKKAYMTQEQLADHLGLSFQAVSKWENGQSCPDILLLPELSRIFGISIDELLGKEAQVEPEAAPATKPAEDSAPLHDSVLPWPDDQTLRLVLFQGHRLLKHDDSRNRDFTFNYLGDAMNVSSQCSITCGDIENNATAGLSINGGDIGGDCHAGRGVECGDIGGDCNAGSNITCGDIGGDCNAGGNIACGDIGGDCHAEGNVECGDIGGSCQTGGHM